ncbi:hypothetical protein [Nocardia sp. NPDC005998]|uniref:hypothetical protein n=1 Tax=Nocardia sp. NPDC005998 TaxID=3156894 RepID=UPI0033AAC5B8
MIDYRVHLAALDAFREQLALTNFNEPVLAAARDAQVADADQQPGAVALGAMIDHVIWHASSDGYELDLLRRAADLWKQGLAVYETLGEFRLRLETALSDPHNANAVAGLNTATAQIQPLTQQVLTQIDDIQVLRQDIATMKHLPPHPRQEDRTLTNWRWGDLFLARRTEAFAREIRNIANDQQTSAFALGVLSSYGANAAGSAYLTQVVGGPRRAHPYRDRLARNTIGSWAAQNDPSVPSLNSVAQTLHEAFPTGLPASMVGLIENVASNVFRDADLPAFPDLQLGYERLQTHLKLLDSFRIPQPPAVPREPFQTLLFGDLGNPYQPSIPEDTGLVEAGQPPGAGKSPAGGGGIMPQNIGTDDGPDHSEPPASTEVKCGPFWESIGWAFLFLLGGWMACVIRWKDHDRCQLWDDITQNWEAAFPGGVNAAVEISAGDPQALTSDNIDAISQSDQIAQLIGDLHNLQCLTWEGLQKAYEFLAVFGLVYPDQLLDRWRYRQYVAIPSVEPGDWPKLPETGPRWDEYPNTNVELAASFSVRYTPGDTPAAVLARVPAVGTTSAADLSLQTWTQMALGEQDSTNLDLDADRAWLHACWQPRGSITDQPINVGVLSYDEI